MALIKMTAAGVENRKTRVLQVGPPNARKTTNFLTWPRPICIISYPGEKGYDTIPTDDPEVTAFVWEDAKDSGSLVKAQEVEKVVTEILAGKHGKFQTVIGDGLHKFAEVLVDAAADGKFFSPSPDDDIGFAWGRGRMALMDHLNTLMHSTIPHVGFSCWDDYEKDRKQAVGEKASDYQKYVGEHIYPAFMGKLAKRMMGEFSVVCYCIVKKNAQGKDEYLWQIRPGGQVWGAGVKLPPERAKLLPEFVPTGFDSLRKVLYGDGSNSK